ncbi:MAG: hypothetical protein IT236_10590, partial [Bacteroidia bacterium]|nr:hypothetical protein [Bacteroidia bacterium]
GWAILQSIIGLSGFYSITNTLPPRFILAVLPPVVGMIILFNTKGGKAFIDSLNAKTLTLFHTIRVPIELVLFWLFLYKGVPELMTFEGRNFDIFAGLSAPLIYYYGFIKQKLSYRIIIAWNVLGLILLFNILVNAILSVQTPFQQFAFEQPNVAVFVFPFILLPAFLVPMVLFAHLVCIRQLLLKSGTK